MNQTEKRDYITPKLRLELLPEADIIVTSESTDLHSTKSLRTTLDFIPAGDSDWDTK